MRGRQQIIGEPQQCGHRSFVQPFGSAAQSDLAVRRNRPSRYNGDVVGKWGHH